MGILQFLNSQQPFLTTAPLHGQKLEGTSSSTTVRIADAGCVLGSSCSLCFGTTGQANEMRWGLHRFWTKHPSPCWDDPIVFFVTRRQLEKGHCSTFFFKTLTAPCSSPWTKHRFLMEAFDRVRDQTQNARCFCCVPGSLEPNPPFCEPGKETFRSSLWDHKNTMVLQLALQFHDHLLETGNFYNVIHRWQCWHRQIGLL